MRVFVLFVIYHKGLLLIVLINISNTILNNSVLKGTSLSCSWSIWEIWVFLHLAYCWLCLAFVLWDMLPLYLDSPRCLSWRVVGFSSKLLLCLLRWLCVFSIWVHLYDKLHFWFMLKHPCLSGMKSTWSW